MNKIAISIFALTIILLSIFTILKVPHIQPEPVGISSEYIVDASDMINGEKLISDIAKSALNEKEISGLLQMREEEKLARDVYTALGEKWNLKIFTNISDSEQTHTDAIKTLLERYEIPDPTANDVAGVFQSQIMKKLYDDLVAKGQKSLIDALVVGATIEDLDIYDLDILAKETNKQDILITYSNLQKGSRNHMRAFVRNIANRGGTYSPQYISSTAFTTIINSEQERGR